VNRKQGSEFRFMEWHSRLNNVRKHSTDVHNIPVAQKNPFLVSREKIAVTYERNYTRK